MDWARLQMEIDRQFAWMFFWSVVGSVISLWVGYEILKAAIKNGINASSYRWVLVKDDKSGPDIRPER